MDREKVITEIEDALSGNLARAGHVYRMSLNGLKDKALTDALAMLKEQDAENGEWITIWRENDPDTSTHARCSICNRISERPLGGYCKWCGAKMTL